MNSMNHSQRAIGAVVPLIIALGISRSWAVQAFQFRPDQRTLTITTSSLEMSVQGGAVVALKNLQTREVYSTGVSAFGLEKTSTGAMCGLLPELVEPGKKSPPLVARRPEADSPVTFTQASPREGMLVYKGLNNGSPDDELRLSFRIEDKGELSFRMEMRMSDPKMYACDVYLPFVNVTAPAVIMGSGSRFARNDPAFTDRCMRIVNGIYSPPVAVIEGAKGVIGMWPEAKSFGYDDMVVSHRPEGDDVIPQITLAFGAKDPETVGEPGVTRSSWWRLAALPSWLEVARRYRAYLEKKTGVKPLWLHSPAWVRSIHAVCTERPRTSDEAQADKFYADLAAKFDPKKLLLFYWNGDCIILFGDHRYMTKFFYPTPQEIAALRKNGFRWMGYHPYVLVFSPKGKDKHLAETERRGFGIPEGYTFHPDYAGPPEVDKFYDYFRPVSTGYYAKLEESEGVWTLIPGAKIVREYLARNFGNYCRVHQMSGCYLDIMGADHGGSCLIYAPEDRRITEGNDWRRGEELACRAMKEANPELALMSEFQVEWTTIHCFYTWEGETHLTHPTPVKLNHPLRAACWGSYTWTQTETPEALALMAGLPPVRLTDDWSIARAKLYTDEELFHDLPPKWHPDALAYFRARGNRWFQYRRMPWGYAYVEETKEGIKVHLGRVVNQSLFPSLSTTTKNKKEKLRHASARIQHWVGYKNGYPIGLSPTHTYNFMVESPEPEGKIWITHLPEGTFISAIRHSVMQSVIELASVSTPRKGTVRVEFHAKCLGVCDPEKDYDGPFEAGTVRDFVIPIPAGLVFQWQAPKAVDARFTANFLGVSGHLHSNGIPYSYWTYNSTLRHTHHALTPDTPEVPVIEIGTGLHRGWIDQWVELAPDTQPVLRFDIGYAKPNDPKAPAPRPLMWSVRVNAKEMWREKVYPDSAWRPREVSLAEFSGRRALITLSAEECTTEDVRPWHTHIPARFGNVRIVNNPLPEVKPDGAALPRPSRVLFTDRFDGDKLSEGWTVEQSHAHGVEGRVMPANGRVCFTGKHYKYQYLSRSFPEEGNSVQALLEVRPTGCLGRWNPGVGLWWGSGQWAFATLGREGYIAELTGWGAQQIPLKSVQLPVFQERYYGWVKITLSGDKVSFFVSTDAVSWVLMREFPRSKLLAAHPELLLIGRGTGGTNPVFSNDERWDTGLTSCFVGDIVVGRE